MVATAILGLDTSNVPRSSRVGTQRYALGSQMKRLMMIIPTTSTNSMTEAVTISRRFFFFITLDDGELQLRSGLTHCQLSPK